MKAVLIFIVRIYQVCISAPLHYITGPFSGCRFEPSCSQYFIEAVTLHGPWKGAWLGTIRIFRCNPWGGCGYDPVPGWEEYVEKNPSAAYIGRRARDRDRNKH
ncbi:MAG: membrane protein insertion efficiency factor YidD [Verrucomicrobiota bacterium]